MTKKEEDDVRRRSTIQVLEYARSLGAYNRYGKADIDKNIAWLKKQGEQKKQIHFPKFTFDEVLALQCCMETVKKVQEDKELYEKLNLIHSKMYDVYRIENQDEQASLQNNKNIDLTKILKDCPKGTVFWSDDYGKVEFFCIDTSLQHPIKIIRADGISSSYTKEGRRNINFPANCLLWPSRDCRDWNKFTAPWYKKDKFDPKTLNPFDKVLVRDAYSQDWTCGFFSHIVVFDDACEYNVGEILYTMCIPYNDETKHLVGTTEEAPEYYRYWEE